MGMRAILEDPNDPAGEEFTGAEEDVVKLCKELGGRIPCDTQAEAMGLAERLGGGLMAQSGGRYSVLFHKPEPEPAAE